MNVWSQSDLLFNKFRYAEEMLQQNQREHSMSLVPLINAVETISMILMTTMIWTDKRCTVCINAKLAFALF